MDQRTIRILFALLRSAICGTKLTDEERNNYSPDQLQDLLKISSKHDVVHLLVFGLKQNELISKEHNDIEKCILKAVYRYQRINHALQGISKTLEKAKIAFMPLKGSVIRKFYPEPWMRTSCDIDILVKEADLKKAVSALEQDCNCRYEGKGSHDISLFAANGTHVELHYKLVEDGRVGESADVLEAVWDTAVLHEDCHFWYEMPDEMFYFYHIAHMAKHFEHGGCGIRPLIDLWILDRLDGVERSKREELLVRGGLITFAEVARKLSNVWFSGDPHDEISQQMEDFILRGGVYGTTENRVAVQQQKQGGRLQYAVSKIFIPYEVIKFHYPILQKYRWLTPVMEVRRWGKLIFCGHIKRTARELKYNSSISRKDAENTQKFLKNIGL